MKVDWILKAIASGKTLYIQTYTRTISVNARAVASWAKAGRAVLKDGKGDEKGFYIGRGKRYDYVPNTVHVYLQ